MRKPTVKLTSPLDLCFEFGTITENWASTTRLCKTSDDGIVAEGRTAYGHQRDHNDEAASTVFLPDPDMRLDVGGIAKDTQIEKSQ